LRLIAGCVPYAGSYVEWADFKQWLELFPQYEPAAATARRHSG